MNKKVALELKRDRFIYQDQTELNDPKKSNKKRRQNSPFCLMVYSFISV